MTAIGNIASAIPFPASAQRAKPAPSEEDQAEIRRLKQRDAEVRRHEQAHVSAGGAYVNGGPQYEFTRGPDGRQYATGGEVSIDVSPGRSPEETIQKARAIRSAALAPGDPSAQDRRVAAQASQLEAEARQELQKARAEEGENGSRQRAINRFAPAPEASAQVFDSRV